MDRIRLLGASRQLQWLDALSRSERRWRTGVRAAKTIGLRNLPSKMWQVDQGRLAVTIGHDYWVRKLAEFPAAT